MKNISLVIFAFLVGVIKISSAQDTNTVIIGDFNHDGLIDTITFNDQWYCELKSGTGKIFKYVEEEEDLGSFFEFVKFDSTLYEIENKPFLDEFLKCMFHKIPFKESPDNSLFWLLDCNNSKKKIENNIYMDEAYKYTPRWENTVPDPYMYYTKFDSVRWVIFYGHNLHRTYLHKKDTFNRYGYMGYEAITDTTQSVICFNHGVVVNRSGKYAWVFINDIQVTFGHEKLRWPSIMDAKAYRDKVIILQKVFMDDNYVYISDPSKGICIRVNPTLFGNMLVDKIKIDGDKLVYYYGNKNGTIDLPTIISQKFN